MLRIVALEQPGEGTTLTLEGRVIGPWVAELRASCDRILASGSTPLALDLGEVAFVDRDGVQLLKALIDGGVRVVNRPAFVAEQLKALSAC
jgi:anti-anti-sigma regulatory factor